MNEVDNKTIRIALTGATGMLGEHILRVLVKKGYTNLGCLKRSSSVTSHLDDLSDSIEWIEGDLMDIDALERLISKSDYVIHAAALISMGKNGGLMKEINVLGTHNVVNVCLEQGVKRLVHVSSVSALGRPMEGGLIDETIEWENHHYTGAYGRSKRGAELEVRRGEAEGLEVNIICPSLILGAGNWDSGSGSLFKKSYEGIPYYPTGETGMVDAWDVADMTVAMMTSSFSGERIISNGHNVTLLKLQTKIAEGLGAKAPRIPLNSFLIQMAVMVEWIKSVFSGKATIITKASLHRSMVPLIYKNDKSLEMMQHNYRPLDETIKGCCNAYLSSVGHN